MRCNFALPAFPQLHWLIGTRPGNCSGPPLKAPWAAVPGDLGPLFALAQRRLEGPLPDDSVATVGFERKRDREWRGAKVCSPPAEKLIPFVTACGLCRTGKLQH